MMTQFEIILTEEADNYFTILKNDNSRRGIFKAVGKALRLMSENLKHPSLETHISLVFYTLFWIKKPTAHTLYVVLLLAILQNFFGLQGGEQFFQDYTATPLFLESTQSEKSYGAVCAIAFLRTLLAYSRF